MGDGLSWPSIILLGQATLDVSLFGRSYGSTGAASPRGRDAPEARGIWTQKNPARPKAREAEAEAGGAEAPP
jgi:hypothetical protein